MAAETVNVPVSLFGVEGPPVYVPYELETTTPIQDLNANLESQAQNLLNQSQNLNFSTLQSTPGISPYGMAQTQQNYLAESQQKSNLATQAIETRGEYAYNAAQSGMDLQTQLANQQLAINQAQQDAQFWGSVLGSAATLGGALILASSEEYKEGVTQEDPRVNEADSNVPQRYLDVWANFLKDNKKNIVDNGITVEQLEQSPFAQSLITQTDDGQKSVDYSKLVGALTASIGDAHDKINFLNQEDKKPDSALKSLNTNTKDFVQQTEKTEDQFQNLDRASTDNIKTLVGNELQYQKALQEEGAAYTAKLRQIQEKYPSQSVVDIQKSLSATQLVMQAFSFLAGGIAQGLTGAQQNPGVQAYNRSVDNLLQTNQQNYMQQMQQAEYVHGETVAGLKNQYEISRDMANIVSGQIKDIKNTLGQNLSLSKNALEAQTMSLEAYDKIQTLRLQQQSIKNDLEVKRQMLLATNAQQKVDPLTVNLTATQSATAKSPKSAEFLDSQLPVLNARILELRKIQSDLSKKQNVVDAAARFRQIGFGTPDKPSPFLGSDKQWKSQFGDTEGWFSDTKALGNLRNSVNLALKQTETYKDELIFRNTVPQQSVGNEQTASFVSDIDELRQSILPKKGSGKFNLDPLDIENIKRTNQGNL